MTKILRIIYYLVTLIGIIIILWQNIDNEKLNIKKEYENKRVEFKYEEVETDFFESPVKNPKITSYFGFRIHPIKKNRRMHYGIDYSCKPNQNIYAVKKGIVSKTVKNHEGFGNYVEIIHQEGYTSLYAHLNHINVQKGQKITSGYIIGGAGCTGSCTGTHLHFEITKKGNNIDPLSLIKKFIYL